MVVSLFMTHRRHGVGESCMRVVSFFVAVLCIATLTIHAAPPSIVYQPADESVDSGTFAEFYAAANGTNDGIPYYQWYRDGAPVSGASGFNPSAYLYITNVMSSDAGDYFVIMTNRFGSGTSQVAHLTVLLRAPVITADPA